MLKYLVTDAQY